MASSNQSTEYPTSTTATVTVSSKGMNYYEALAWMAEKDSNTLAIVNFSDEENPYLIEGGPESLLELEWDESDEECVAEYELYKLRDCPSEYWDSEEEANKIFELDPRISEKIINLRFPFTFVGEEEDTEEE